MSLLVNAEVTRHWPTSVVAHALGMVMALALSLTAGAALFNWTERASVSWQQLRNWQLGAMGTGFLASLAEFF